MNSYIFGRALGTISAQALQCAETTRLLHALELAPQVSFDGRETTPGGVQQTAQQDSSFDGWAHKAGVNCIVIDKFEGRYMLSGGAESSILLWDLEAKENNSKKFTRHPAAAIRKSSGSHKFGITHLSFYPFDSLAFLSSSYDHTLRIYATETLTPSASFDLGSVVYSHALSPIADHLLVACATQHPAIRLVDLHSGASTHSLTGHQGAVLSVSWSPINEYVLASGGSDGTVRLWDIRRSASHLGVLDLEDSIGVGGHDGLGKGARPREQGKAHIGACNGVVWTDDGKFLVTVGHDERVRVWDVGIGANALTHFGPIIKNTHLSSLLPTLPPSHITSPGTQVMLYPNEKEILMFDIFEGTLLKRLRAPRVIISQVQEGVGQRNNRSRVTSLAWRAGNVELYSAHSDGKICAWMPRPREELDPDEEEANESEDGKDDSRKRKREALDEVFRDLTKQKITFI